MEDYQRLNDYYTKLINLEQPSNYDDQRTYSLLCGMECISNYEFIRDFCLKNNFKNVFDIGCCFGYQSEVFYQAGINYRGLDEFNSEDMWNSDIYEYQMGCFPCEVAAKKEELAISVLCLGWNCYLHEGENTLNEQFESLAKQFRFSLIYMQNEFVPIVSKYFLGTKHLEDNFYLFEN